MDAQINADRFIKELGPYDMIMTTKLFTVEACKLIDSAHNNDTLDDLKPIFAPEKDQ